MSIWTVLIGAVALFELWYAAAFFYAYLQVRERLLLLPVLQAILMLIAFVYLGAALANGWSANPVIVLGLLVVAIGISLYWRRSPAGVAQLLRGYPRGTADVLSFRRPAVDLKRRVRTK